MNARKILIILTFFLCISTVSAFNFSVSNFTEINNQDYEIKNISRDLNATCEGSNISKCVFDWDDNTSSTYKGQDPNFNLTNSFNVSDFDFTDGSGSTSDVQGVDFNNNGTKMYIPSAGNDDEVVEYNLSKAFNISSPTFVDRLDISTEDDSITGIDFNGNGSKFYIIGSSTDKIYEYDLSPAYDISTASLVDSFDVSSQDTIPTSLAFNDDGSKLYITGRDGDNVYEYDLSSNYDVSTATFVQSLDVSSQDTVVEGVRFSPTGNRMYVSGAQNDDIYEYELSDNFNISSSTFLKNFSVSSTTPILRGLEFNTNGSRFFVADSDENDIAGYKTDGTFGSGGLAIINNSKKFNTNGNHTFNFTLVPESGSNVTENGTVFINPFQILDFVNDTQDDIDNFKLNGVNYTEEFKKPIFDIIDANERPKNVTFTFEKQGFETTNFTREFNSTSAINDTLEIPFAKIAVEVFDRENRSLINFQTVDLELIGPDGDSASINDGTFNFTNENFSVGQYHVTATSTNYSTETVYFNYNNQEVVDVDIFMLNQNSDDAGAITIVVKDTFSQFIGGAICEAREWTPSSSSYEKVTEGRTNSKGETLLDIEIGTKEYIFRCEKDGVASSLEPEIVSTDLASRTVVLNPQTQDLDEIFKGIFTNVTENVTGNTSEITFEYDDTTNQVSLACINFFNASGTDRKLVAQTCSTSSSATIVQNFSINQNYTLVAEARLEFQNALNRTVDTFRYSPAISITNFLKEYNLKVWVPLILVIAGLSLGVLANNLNIIFMSMGIGAWVSFTIVPSIITGSVAVAITFIMALASWASYRKGK